MLFLGVQKSDSKFHSKNYFEVNTAKENCSASLKILVYFHLGLFQEWA